MKNEKTIRIDKLLSERGFCSRRGTENFIKSHKVCCNGVRIIEHGQRVNLRSNITIDGQPIKKIKRVYFLLNKPKGIVSTANDEFGRKNVVSLIKTEHRIYPVGRLDRETHGLLLLTNDGELTNLLIHPRYHIGKTYLLTIRGSVAANQLEKLKKGVELEDGITQKSRITILQRMKDKTILEMTIFEGRKRQIRRMCEALNLDLMDLMRIRIGNLNIEDLKTGEYRVLSGKEIENLKKLANNQASS